MTIVKLNETELSVFSVIISEPNEWVVTRLSDDMGFDVLPVVDRLRKKGVIAHPNRLYATQKGVLFAEDLGLTLGYKRPKYVNRRRVKKLYKKGVTNHTEIADALNVTRAVAWYHVRRLQEAGEI